MFSNIKLFVLLCLGGMGILSAAWGQRQPQDSFFLERVISSASISISYPSVYGIAVDASNQCYMTTGSGVYVYNIISGTAVTNWSLAGVHGVAYDPISNLVVCSSTAFPQINLYNTQFQHISSWGTNALSKPDSIAVGPDGLLYIADYGGPANGNNSVWVFNLNGGLVRSWSYPYTNLGGLCVSTDGSVFTESAQNGSAYQIVRFDPYGNVLAYTNVGGNWDWASPPSVSADGLLIACNQNNLFVLLAADLSYLYLFNPTSTVYGGMGATAFSPSGDRLVVLLNNAINVYRRCYRTAGANPPVPLPLPYIWNVTQQSGTAWIGANFLVTDDNNTNVTCAAYALVNGQTNLLSFVPVQTFVTNGTDVLSLTNISTGVTNHFTWNAGVDWASQYGYVKLVLMAHDNRNLLDIHFITCPPNVNPSVTYTNPVTISQSPFKSSDFLTAWCWLLCTNPSVTLSNGNVYSSVNNYGVANGTLLAQTTISGSTTNTTTTAYGLTFILSMMSSNLPSSVFYSNKIIRLATTNEITQAMIGTTGNPTNVVRWTPLVQINGLPANVNEFGFDTGFIGANGSIPTNVWWVVLAPPGQ